MSTFERVQWVIMTPAASLASFPAIPTKKPRLSPFLTAPFYGLSGEVPDLYETDLLEVGQETHRGPLGEPSGRENEMVEALRAHHVDSLHHARGPRGGREGTDDAGRPEDGDAADDAEPGVRGLLRHLLAARHADHNAYPAFSSVEHLIERIGDHAPRDVVYGGTADRQPQPRLRDYAHAFSPVQRDPRLLLPGDADREARPVRHVRVVARVLDDDGLSPALPHLAPLDLEGDAPLISLLREASPPPLPCGSPVMRAVAAALAAAAAQVPWSSRS